MRHSIFKVLQTVFIGLMLNLCVVVNASYAYPTKPVHIVVPYPPGGATDVVTRIIAAKLSARLDQPVVVDNKPGAASIIGSDFVAKSEPDGYTLLMASNAHGTNPSLYSKLPYDSIKDFTPIALVAKFPYALVVYPGVPVKNVMELINYLKQKPGQVNMSAGAVGTSQHLTAERFKRSVGVDVLLVPYKGSGVIMPDLMAGRTSLAFENQAVVLPYIKSGAIKALAVTGEQRSPLLPDVPTMTEAGVDNFVAIGWLGIFAAARTPDDIVSGLNKEIAAIMQETDARARFAAIGATPLSGPPGDLRDQVSRDIEVWGKVIREAGITKLD